MAESKAGLIDRGRAGFRAVVVWIGSLVSKYAHDHRVSTRVTVAAMGVAMVASQPVFAQADSAADVICGDTMFGDVASFIVGLFFLLLVFKGILLVAAGLGGTGRSNSGMHGQSSRREPLMKGAGSFAGAALLASMNPILENFGIDLSACVDFASLVWISAPVPDLAVMTVII